MTPFEIMSVFIIWLLGGAGIVTTGIVADPWWLRLGLILLGMGVLWGAVYWAIHVFPPLPPGDHVVVV